MKSPHQHRLSFTLERLSRRIVLILLVAEWVQAWSSVPPGTSASSSRLERTGSRIEGKCMARPRRRRTAPSISVMMDEGEPHVSTGGRSATTSNGPLVRLMMSRSLGAENDESFTVVSPTKEEASSGALSSSSMPAWVLAHMAQLFQAGEPQQYAEQRGLGPAEAAMYALFTAWRRIPLPLGLSSAPWHLPYDSLLQQVFKPPAAAASSGWSHFFTVADLQQAVQEDFLDAARGITPSDAAQGWQITQVSQPRGDSFEEARMTYTDIQRALDQGTVIMNAAGAHIPKLAGPCLACTDATALPNAVNLYLTAAERKTSAPPHTDQQDVVVIQMQGRKHWRVFSPVDPSIKPAVSMFARGKLDDKLALHAMTTTWKSRLLLEVTLSPGDVLFVPAAFPHTTSTVTSNREESLHNQDATTSATASEEDSLHLTFNLDHHIWDLDYASARRLALQRAGVIDTALKSTALANEERYTGLVNELPLSILSQLVAALPLGLLDDDPTISQPLLTHTVSEVQRISRAVDENTAGQVEAHIWQETIERLVQQGRELLEIHRDMYVAALEEGRLREAEQALEAAVSAANSAAVAPHQRAMTPERMQRLSVFRVKRYYDMIQASKQALHDWAVVKRDSELGSSKVDASGGDWAWTAPLEVGDEVEADLGGAMFPAKVTAVHGTRFDVEFFDGDREVGLQRHQIKRLTPPAVAALEEGEVVDFSSMTPKQIKRWKKQNEKK